MESNMAIFKIMMMYAIVSISAAAYDPLSKTNSEKVGGLRPFLFIY